jgi:hypothetical protein
MGVFAQWPALRVSTHLGGEPQISQILWDRMSVPACVDFSSLLRLPSRPPLRTAPSRP